MTSDDPANGDPAAERSTPPRPDVERRGNYRPIDGPIPGIDDGARGPDGVCSGADDDAIKRQFVDGARGIETPRGDPVAAGVLVDLAVEDGTVTATVDCSSLESSDASRVGNRMEGIGLAIEGVDHVRLESARTRRTDGRIAPNGVDAIVAIAGAKGGTGKSTLTLELASRLDAAGLEVGVFDADFQAPDLTELAGVEGPIVATAGGDPEPATVAGLQLVSIDLIAGDRPAAWRGAMTHDVLEDLLENAAWQDRDVLLVDLPPGQGAVAERLFQRVAVDGAVLVTTPAAASLRNVERTAGLLDACDVPVTAVVENMASGEFRSGDRSVDDLLEVAPGQPRHVTVPFDPALQRRPIDDDRGLETDTEAAMATLSDAVRDRLAAVAPTGHEDALDLSGLPADLQEKQAVLEVAAADEPASLVVDAEDVPTVLADEFDGGVAVSDVGGGRRLVRAGGETA